MNHFDHRRLQTILQAIFIAQAQEMVSKFNLSYLDSNRPVPFLVHWIPVMVKAVKPVLTRQYQIGMLRSSFSTLRNQRSPAREFIEANSRGMRHYEPTREDIFGDHATFLQGKSAGIGIAKGRRRGDVTTIRASFDLYNPRVLDAVDEACFKFCRATMETAQHDTETALQKLRGVLKRGLKKDIALKNFTRNIRRIFADTARARLIAITETRRATYAGQVLAAREGGAVKKLRWVTNPGACERCQKLNGKKVKLDKPFHIDEDGGPYALTYHPPLHPHCECDLIEEI